MSARVVAKLWGAHACSVLVAPKAFGAKNFPEWLRSAGRYFRNIVRLEEVRFGRMPKPVRCKRALPRFPLLSAFTIIELLIVMAVIIILAGLVLVAAGYVREKGYRSRAEAEIAAISAAVESYRVDNGIYPGAGSVPPAPASDTDALDAKAGPDPGATPIPNEYMKASLVLYKALTGDANYNAAADSSDGKSYFQMKPQMLSGTKDTNGNLTAVTHIRDPFGNSYGYSTAFQYDPNKGYNPTFDLWSTAGTATNQAQWIKNW